MAFNVSELVNMYEERLRLLKADDVYSTRCREKLIPKILDLKEVGVSFKKVKLAFDSELAHVVEFLNED